VGGGVNELGACGGGGACVGIEGGEAGEGEAGGVAGVPGGD
jgi:hypothetical protein